MPPLAYALRRSPSGRLLTQAPQAAAGRSPAPLRPGRRGVSSPGATSPDGDGASSSSPPPQPTQAARPARRRRARPAADPVEQATFAEWARGALGGKPSGGGAAPNTNGGWGRPAPPPAAALESGGYEGPPGSPEATLQNVLAVSLALLLGAALAGMAVRVVAVAAALAAAALRYTAVAILLLFFALFFTP